MVLYPSSAGADGTICAILLQMPYCCLLLSCFGRSKLKTCNPLCDVSHGLNTYLIGVTGSENNINFIMTRGTN